MEAAAGCKRQRTDRSGMGADRRTKLEMEGAKVEVVASTAPAEAATAAVVATAAATEVRPEEDSQDAESDGNWRLLKPLNVIFLFTLYIFRIFS
jgi:hypothetical protein